MKAKIILRKKLLSNGESPLVVRVAHLKQQAKYYRIDNLTALSSQWNEEACRFNSKKRNHKELNKLLTQKEDQIDDILSILSLQDNFTFENFQRLLIGNDVDYNIYNAFKKRIATLNKNKKFGNAMIYEANFKSFKKHFPSSFTFKDISFNTLKSFEQFLIKEGNSGNTMSLKFRSVRALHYEWAKENNLNEPNHIYRRFNIKRLETKTKNRSMSNNDFKKLFEYIPQTTNESLVLDVYRLSFLFRGGNLQDLCLLTKANIKGDRIVYRRSKTQNEFVVSISNEIQSLLNKYNTGSNYLLPIVPINTFNTKIPIKRFNRNVNQTLQRICKKIDIERITMYSARYFFVNAAMQTGATMQEVSNALGHSSIETTKIYISKLQDEKLDDITNTILDNINKTD